MRRILFLVMSLLCMMTRWAVSEDTFTLRDRKTSGYKANVDKIGSKYGLVTKKIQVDTVAASSQISCTNSSATVADASTGRVIIAFLNQTTVDAFVCLTGTCTSTTGIRFQENQGYVAEHYTGAVSCITSAGTATLGVYEQ